MSENNKNAASKLFNKIVMHIHNLNPPESDISMERSRRGARTFTQFCQKLAEIEVRREIEQEQQNGK